MGELFDELERLRSEMRQIVRQLYFAPPSGGFLPEKVWHPPMDVFLTGDSVVALLEVAGVDGEEVRVEIADGVLTISGYRKQLREEGKAYVQMEIRYGRFQRRIKLPASVDASKISACIKNGFLRVEMPTSAKLEEGTSIRVPIQVE